MVKKKDFCCMISRPLVYIPYFRLLSNHFETLQVSTIGYLEFEGMPLLKKTLIYLVNTSVIFSNNL